MEIKTKVSGGPDVGPNGLMLFASTGTETAFAQLFVPEMWSHGTPVKPHISWQKTTNAAGGVVFQLRHRHLISNEVPGDFGDWIVANATEGTVDSTQKIIIQHFPDIALEHGAENTELIHEQVQFEIRRVPSETLDTYGADVRLLSLGVHFQVQWPGSINEI